MRITNLQIKNKEYKNLDIDLNNNTSGVMAFIGNNGSGKSNLLESLCIVFHYLYNKKEKDIPFNFSITYTNSGSTEKINITKNKTTVISTIEGRQVSDTYDQLPKQIVAIYSGEEDRLWKKWFKPVYDDYINNITSGKSTGIGVYNEMPKMLYINKYYWHISLLCLLLHRKIDEADTFCSNILNIKEVHSVKLKFNKDNYKNYPDSSVKTFIQFIDKKEEYTLDDFYNLIELVYPLSDVYKFLYIAFTPDKKKMVEDITIKYNDENLEIADFSEGEKKMLLIKSALEFAGAEDSLFILDEPDAHIHMNNKIQIKKVFEKYSDNRQVVITTHSPTLTDALDENSLYMLNQGKLVPQQKQEILESVSGDFWNKFQQNAFISSRKPIVLLVEGKHDKEHIANAYDKLKNEFKDLDFDIFILNGESKIKPFIAGLYESDFQSDNIYIGVYDNDSEGIKSFGNGYNKIEGKLFKKLIESNNKVNESYFSMLLPKPDGITCDCTIETMYDSDKFLEALSEAYYAAKSHIKDKSIDDISKNIKEGAKNLLAEKSSTFNKEDFKNFRKLFSSIRDVLAYSKNSGSSNFKSEINPLPSQEPRGKQTNVQDDVKNDETKSTQSDFIEIYTDKRNTDIHCEYYPNEDKFVLKKGSKLSIDTVSSFGRANYEKRKLELNKIATVEGNQYILSEDTAFSSSSGSINYATGGNMNGWDDWLIKENGKPLSTIRAAGNGIKIEFQESVFNELLSRMNSNWKVEMGNKANLSNAQIWIKPSTSNKLWFGIETFSGKGNFSNSLIMGIFSVKGVVKRKELASVVNDPLLNSKGYWLEYMEVQEGGSNLDFNSNSLILKIENDSKYRNDLLHLIVNNFIKYFDRRKTAVLDINK